MPLRNSFEMQEEIARLYEEQGYAHQDFVLIGEPLLRFDGKTVIAGYEADSTEHGRRLFVYAQWEQGRASSILGYSIRRVLEIGDDDYEQGRDRILHAHSNRLGARDFLDETYPKGPDTVY